MEKESYKQPAGVLPEKSRAEKSAGLELSPEELNFFEGTLEEALYKYHLHGDSFSNYENFLYRWGISNDNEKELLYNARIFWFEIKKTGEKFEKFITKKMRRFLAGYEKDYNSFYDHLKIYTCLGYENAPAFLREALGSKLIWANGDGSVVHRIFGFFERGIKDDKSADSVMQYIKNALSDEYGRKDLLDTDLSTAVNTLRVLLGDKTKGVLESLAKEDNTFQGWFQKNKLITLSEKKIFAPEKINFKKFDEEIEMGRLNSFYNELIEIWSALDESETEKEGGRSEESYYDERFPELEYKEEYGKNEVYENLNETAGSWEEKTLINFFGRFKPGAKEPVPITEENYMKALYKTYRAADSGKSRENCLNFISGIVEKNIIEAKDEDKKTFTVEDAYGLTALVFARAISLGALENKTSEAVAEIDRFKEYLSLNRGQFSDARDASFIDSFIDKLGFLQTEIYSEKTERTTLMAPLGESAKSFFMYHDSTKRVREIPDFNLLLAEKIRWILATDLSFNLKDIKLTFPSAGPSLERLRNVLPAYREAIMLYNSVEKDGDIPAYFEAKKNLEEAGENRIAVFGRDGRYFFTALKAGGFGKKTKKELKYVIVTSPMKRYDVSSMRDVADYLSQNGVNLEFAFVDTGYVGSVPEFAIKALANAGGTELSEEYIDDRIKLLSSEKPRRRELLNRGKSGVVGIIEDRPKNIHSPENLVLEGGKLKPEIKPASIEEQLGAWVVEHAVFRNFAPKLNVRDLPTSLKISESQRRKIEESVKLNPDEILDAHPAVKENLTIERSRKFSSFIEAHLSDIDQEIKQELLKDAMLLYEISRDKVGPVIKDYARWCLVKLEPWQKLIFLARDALGPWLAAKVLLRQGEFADIREDQLKYLYLSRKVIMNESPEIIKKYISQAGINKGDDKIIMADVGMYGFVHNSLQEMYPEKELHSLFLISASSSPEMEGFLYDRNNPPETGSIWNSISGNPAVHFLEDTFSGFYGTATELVKQSNGAIKPKLKSPYSREVYLKRLAALTGIIDRAVMEDDGRDPELHKKELEDYLEKDFQKDKDHIMIPHE